MLFSVFIAPEFVRLELYLGLALCFALFFITCAFLLLTWLVEPGILPTVEVVEQMISSAPSEDYLVPPLQDLPKPLVLVYLQGKYYHLSTFRALKSKWTKSGVEEYDHWCPYLGNAIGKRNYRYYVLFLTMCFTTCFNNVGWASYVLFQERHDASRNGDKLSINLIVFIVYSLGMGLSLLCLLVHHWRLVCMGMTTLEANKASWETPFQHKAPYSLGVCGNLRKLFCSAHFPSRVTGDLNLPKSGIVATPPLPRAQAEAAAILSLSQPLLGIFSPQSSPLPSRRQSMEDLEDALGEEEYEGL